MASTLPKAISERLSKVLAAALWSTAAAAHDGATAGAWDELGRLEADAFRTFRFQVVIEAEKLGEQLWVFAHPGEQPAQPASCLKAAETLAHMVMGYVSSARRLDVPSDWYYFAPSYAEHRRACLTQLDIDERRFPLPFWYGQR